MRTTILGLVIAATTALSLACGALPAQADADFNRWLEQLWPEAQAQGIARVTFDAAARGLEPDLSLPDLVIPGRVPANQPGQAEFIKPPGDYLAEGSFNRLTEQGRKLAAVHAAALAAIEKQYGVPGPILLAIFGRETNYGTYRLPHNAIRVLATQAYLGTRKDKFRAEFILALKMLQDGAAKLPDMRSSWAGAMGLTQFMPSDFYKYGIDFDGDGKIDLWNSVPDALASAARQLLANGWQPGRPWGAEVRVPAGIDCTSAAQDKVRTVRAWLTAGIAPAGGRTLPPAVMNDDVSLLLPGGIYGPGFFAFKNFYVIKEYNFSDLYVLFVGHLADRIAGAKPFSVAWGKLVQLRERDVKEMQQLLTAEGLYRDVLDGKAGQKTRLALGEYQKKNWLKLDCWPTVELLAHMRAGR